MSYNSAIKIGSMPSDIAIMISIGSNTPAMLFTKKRPKRSIQCVAKNVIRKKHKAND